MRSRFLPVEEGIPLDPVYSGKEFSGLIVVDPLWGVDSKIMRCYSGYTLGISSVCLPCAQLSPNNNGPVAL